MIDRSPDRLPRPPQALPRRLPALPARRSTRSCATSTRSSPASASTSTRSPRRWPTSPPPPTRVRRSARPATRSTTCGRSAPSGPESLATFRAPLHQPQQRLQPAARLPAACRGPAQLRHTPVQLGHHRLAQPRNAQRPRLRRTASPKTTGPLRKTKKAAEFFERLKKYAFAEQNSSASIPAPACTQQPPFEPVRQTGPADRLPADLRPAGRLADGIRTRDLRGHEHAARVHLNYLEAIPERFFTGSKSSEITWDPWGMLPPIEVSPSPQREPKSKRLPTQRPAWGAQGCTAALSQRSVSSRSVRPRDRGRAARPGP